MFEIHRPKSRVTTHEIVSEEIPYALRMVDAISSPKGNRDGSHWKETMDLVFDLKTRLESAGVEHETIEALDKLQEKLQGVFDAVREEIGGPLERVAGALKKGSDALDADAEEELEETLDLIAESCPGISIRKGDTERSLIDSSRDVSVVGHREPRRILAALLSQLWWR